MVNSGLFSSRRGDWETPQDLFDQLDQEFGPIPLDVCAWDWNAKCPAWFTIFDDGLSLDWGWVLREVLHADRLVCWMNPPYGREISKWVEKAAIEARRGVATIALLPARTDTRWWHTHIWDGERHCRRPWIGERIRFLKGRLKFSGATSSAPFPSAIVVFGFPWEPRGDRP